MNHNANLLPAKDVLIWLTTRLNRKYFKQFSSYGVYRPINSSEATAYKYAYIINKVTLQRNPQTQET